MSYGNDAIYLDHAATTPTDPSVVQAMVPPALPLPCAMAMSSAAVRRTARAPANVDVRRVGGRGGSAPDHRH